MTEPAPFLTNADRCSDCRVQAISAAKDEMKVCPKCFAVLWHIDYLQTKSAIHAAELAQRRLQAKAERERIRQERMAVFLAGKEPDQ